MLPVIKDGGDQPAGVVQEPAVDAPDLEFELNRSELLGDEGLNLSSLFPENTVFLTPDSPEIVAAEANQESTVPKEVPYLSQSDACAGAPGFNPFFDQNEQTNQERSISPLPVLDFSCLTIGGQTLDDPLQVYNTLEPFIPDQPDAASNGADYLNLSQTKFDELHSPRPSPPTEKETTDEQTMQIESSNLATLSPVEQIVVDPQPAIQIAISIDPSATNTPQTVQWSMTVPSDDATCSVQSAPVPIDQTPALTQPIDQAHPAGQQTILIYNPHAATQETALTSVGITPPAPVDLSLQNMLVAAARRKHGQAQPVRHNVIPVVSYSRDQLTVIPAPANPSQSCAEFFSNFTDEINEEKPAPAAGSSSPSGYLEIPSNYVVSSNGQQQVFKVHELYKAPQFHPLVEEEMPVVPVSKVTGKKRQRRTDIDYATGFECKPCQKTFGKKGSLEQHKRSHHSEPRPYLCKQCGKSFPTVEKLYQHEQNHLPGNKRFQCTECEKRYVHAKDRDRHYLAHHGTGTFACKECPKAFARRDHLLAHIVSHRKRQERAARKEALKVNKQVAAKERVAKKARHGSTTGEGTESTSSDSGTDYSSEESCDEMLRKISAGVAN